MDDQEALLARRVAQAASAHMRVHADVLADARLVEAVEQYDAYMAPTLGGEDELLDAVADDAMPTPIGESVIGLKTALRAAARKTL